jgi:membrane protease YdiL (CAAX protease family)
MTKDAGSTPPDEGGVSAPAEDESVPSAPGYDDDVASPPGHADGVASPSGHAEGLSSPPQPTRPGLGLFTIEGRAAPGLFVVGWLATILGFGILIVGAIAPSAVFVYFVGPVLLSIGLIAGCGNQAIERRSRGEAYAGPSPYLVFAAMIAAVYAVGYPIGLVLSFLLGSAQVPSFVVRFIGVALQSLVFIGVIRLTVVGTGALSWAEMGWRRFDRDRARDLGAGLALALPIFALTSVVAAVLVAIFQAVPEAPLPPTGVPSGTVIQLIAGGLIAPIAEETVFRGFALTAWRRPFGDRGALVRASLLFALAHVINVGGDSLPQVAGVIVVGFVTRLPVAFALGWLFLRRGTIWAPLGLHIGFNGVILILAEIATRAATGGS